MNIIEETELEKPIFTKKLKVFFVVLFFIIILIYSYARFVGTTGIIIKEYEITNKQIPDSFNGVKIIHFSDLHYGRTINKIELQTIVTKINRINPDIVIFSGDLIDTDVKTTNKIVIELTESLSNITSTIGKYAVVGNHDYKNGFYTKIMSDSKFMLLNNNYDIAYNKSLNPIFIGGLGSVLYRKADIDSTLSYFNDNPDLFKLVIVHEPDYMKKIENKNVDVVLAGHSHNGQVRLPIIGKIITPKGAKTYYEPYYNINNTDLYISSGLGTSGHNVRLFNRPSINYYRLYNK